MEFRSLGRTDWKVSTVSFGAWAIGGTFGPVKDDESMAALHRALDKGVNFFDTADVYGDGRSEQLLAQLRRERKEPFYITTKAGRRLPEQTVEGYTKKNLTAFVDRSLKNLAVETIDLLQIHCPPTDAFYHPEVFGIFDDFVKAGKIRFYGVSVERVEEALKAIDYPNVQSVQLVYNMFRQRPGGPVPGRGAPAQGRGAGAAAAVVGDAGGQDDAREQVRRGRPPQLQPRRRALGQGGDVLRRALRAGPGGGRGAAQAGARRGEHGGVRAALDPDERRGHLRHPGRQASGQVDDNCAAGDLPALADETMARVRELYERKIKNHVHWYW